MAIVVTSPQIATNFCCPFPNISVNAIMDNNTIQIFAYIILCSELTIVWLQPNKCCILFLIPALL